MSNKKYCVVCKSYSEGALIKFPKDPVLLELWLTKTGITKREAIQTATRICLVHFEGDQWIYKTSKTNQPFKALREDAVPTLYLGQNARQEVEDTRLFPPLKKVRTSRCALCNVSLLISQAVAIVDKHDAYTDFGAALAYLLRMTFRGLASRYCCVDCSEEVFACFGNIVNINVSTLLTASMVAKNECDVDKLQSLYERRRIEGRDGSPPPINITMPTMKDVKESGKLGHEETCYNCNGSVLTLRDFTEHITNHFFECKSIFQKTAVTTQTDEVEIDMGIDTCHVDYESDNSPYSFSYSKRSKRSANHSRNVRYTRGAADIEFATHDDGSAMTPQDIEEEAEPVIETTQDEMKLIEGSEIEEIKTEYYADIKPDVDYIDYLCNDNDTGLPEDAIIEEHLMEESEDEIIEEHLLSETEAETADETAVTDVNTETECETEMLMALRPKRFVRRRRSKFPATGGMCDVCGKSLKNAASFKMHMRLHDEDGLYNSGNEAAMTPRDCEICGASLKHLASYKQHMLRVHSASSTTGKVCDICGQVRNNLTQHKKTCLQSLAKGRKTSSSTCGVCGKIFATRYMTKHLKLHTMEEDIARNGMEAVSKYVQQCPLCGKKTSNMTIHMSKVHKIIEDDNELRLNNDFTNHDCTHCGAHFEQRPLLVNHLILKHGLHPKMLPKRGRQGVRAKWTCSVCAQVFPTYGRIKKHTQADHNGVGIDLSCENCGKRYNTIEALREHINVKHINYYEFNCFPCDKHFVNEETYRKHLMYYCRLNGFGRKRPRRSDEPLDDANQADPICLNSDGLDQQQLQQQQQISLVEMAGVDQLTDDINDEVDVDPEPVQVYLPHDSMVVVYEEV